METTTTTLRVEDEQLRNALWGARGVVAHLENFLHRNLGTDDNARYNKAFEAYEKGVELMGMVERMAFAHLPIKFTPGIVRFAPGVVSLAEDYVAGSPRGQEKYDAITGLVEPYIVRHITGDYGLMDEGDCKLNEAAIKEDTRVVSKYEFADDPAHPILVITEHNRSVTTVMLPSEY